MKTWPRHFPAPAFPLSSVLQERNIALSRAAPAKVRCSAWLGCYHVLIRRGGKVKAKRKRRNAAIAD